MEFVGVRNVNIKDEPVDVLETMESVECRVIPENNTVVNMDPMNLLEIVAQRCSEDEQELTVATGNGQNDGTVDKWRQWIKTYPWLLRRAEGKRLGFCLYCGKNMNVEGVYYLERHNCALIHKERQHNYEAFLYSCKETFDEEGLHAIKQEIDSDNSGRVSEELVAKRLERAKALNDFNWKHWLSAHSWLVRENSEDELSTKGFCKYCKCVFDVEFSLTRQRHEQSIKHKLGGTLHLGQENGEPFDGSGEFNKATGNDAEAMDETLINNIDNHVTSKVLKGRLFDKVANSSTHRMCRVCRVVMDKHSCRKHMKSKLHRRNMQALAISSRKDKRINICTGSSNNMPVDWSKYTKIHSWICADPDDPKYAYCSYCEKRFMYGLSTVKRALHEKSLSHCEAMKRKLGNREGNNTIPSEANGQQQNVNMEYDCEESESAANESILKRKRALYNDKWFELNPCYQRNEDDEDYIYCKCCNVMLLIKNLNIGKHEKAERHRLAQQIQAEGPKGDSTETNMQVRKENHVNFSWMRRTKNGQVFCKVCRVVLSQQYRPAAHERTDRHKWAAKKYFSRKNEQDNQSLKSERKTFGGPQVESVVSDEEMKPAMCSSNDNGINWQQKYEWLTFHESEIRQFYGYCNYCKQSVFVPTSTFASKHECSATHIRSQLNQRRQSELDTSLMSKSEETHKYRLYKWLLPDPEENRNFGYCKYCKTRVMTEGLMALGHHNSRSHRKATQLHLQNQKNDGSDDTNQSSMLDTSRTDQLHNMECVNPEESGSEMSLATRLTNAHTEMLSLIREVKSNNNRQNISTLPGPLSGAASVSPMDADICYSRVSEQLNGKLELNVLNKAKRERNTYDLFFESMNEAVKKLPSDLAAESRVKIMQIVYDLEMRALQRTKSEVTQSPPRETSSPQTTTTLQENSTSVTKPNTDGDDEVIPDNEEKSTNQCTNSDSS